MKRAMLAALITSAWAAGSGQNVLGAEAYDDTGAWYLSTLAQYTLLDEKRVSQDKLGYQIGIGYNFAPNFAGEVGVSSGSFPLRGTGFSEKLTATSLDMLYKFAPVTSFFRPYLLTGAGWMTDNIGHVGDNNNKWLAEAGVGLLTGLGSQSGSTRLQLRTEAKYRYEFSRNMMYVPRNPGDVIFGVGFQWMFGAPTPPPPTLVKQAPPLEEPPPVPPLPPAPEPCHAPAGFQVDANCRIIEQRVVVRAVDFEYNSAQLTGPARQTLDEVASAVRSQSDLTIEVQGHTDSVGGDSYNLHLSQRRAESVKAYLVGNGVSASVLTAKGYGKSQPLVSNATAEGRAQNRRVAFAVSNVPAHLKVVTEDASAASTEAAKQSEPPKTKKRHQ